MKIKKTSIFVIIVAVLLVTGATTVFTVLATTNRDVNSSVPDGYASEVLSGAEDHSWEDWPIAVDSPVGVLVTVEQLKTKQLN